MSRSIKTLIVCASVFIFSYAAVGYVLGKADDDDKAYRSLGVYGEVLQRIQDDYVDTPNLSVVTAGALHGLLESLDPYSSYLSPREFADYKEKQKNTAHADIGAILTKRFGYIAVVSVLPESPADKAGIRKGDLFESLGGFATRDMSVEQADLLLEGAPGSQVKLEVVKRGSTDPDAVTVTREPAVPEHLTADKIADDTGYIRIPELEAGSAAELRDRLGRFNQMGLHKLVLDLRDCASGTVAEAISAAQLFVPSGTLATLKGQTVSSQEFGAAPDKVIWRGPMEVLVSDSTSGPAEVLAGALEGNHRAEVVGLRTAGSASEQKLISLDDGAALILTTALYYTPDNKAILPDGIAPTVAVAESTQDLNNPDLEPAGPLHPNQLPGSDDPTLHKALDQLKVSAATAPAARDRALTNPNAPVSTPLSK